MDKSRLLASFQYGVQSEGRIYGISTKTGVLLEYNIDSNEIGIVGTNEAMLGKWAYSSYCSVYKRKFIAVSNLSNELLIYDLDNSKSELIELIGVQSTTGAFSALFVQDEMVIIIPKYDDIIIRYNLVSGTIENIDCEYSGIKYDVIKDGDSIFFLYETGKIDTLRIDNLLRKREYYDGKQNEFIRLGIFEGKLYGLSKHGAISLIKNDNCCEKICNNVNDNYYPGCFIKTDKGFTVLPALGSNIYLNQSGNWILVDKIEDAFVRFDDPKRGAFEKYVQYGEEIFFLTKKLDRFLVINVNTADTRWVQPKTPMRWEYLKLHNGKVVIEDEWCLSDLLDSLER